MKRTIVIFTILALCGCALPLKVEKLQDFTPQSRTFILINDTEWYPYLRAEFSKKKLKVLKFASNNQVTVKGNTDNELARVYNEAEARYGLDLTCWKADSSITQRSLLLNCTLEVTDIKTNEVLLVIEKGGWTRPFGLPRDMIFEDLASTLDKEWKM